MAGGRGVTRRLMNPNIASCIRLSAALLAGALPAGADALINLKQGDHIAIVGSGLADRQQHQAWFETLIQQAFADEHLTIRNLGFSADEIDVHPRSADVPPTDWFLGMKKGDTTPPGQPEIIYKAGTDFGADVIFAYWGFNESFQGPQGIEDFKGKLRNYLQKLKSAKYNGESAPRIVLFSPIAQEELPGAEPSNSEENNRNIGLYTHAMAEVAKENDVPFVDLFKPSQELYQQNEKALTINGIHLNDSGDRQLAPIQFEAVFGKKPASLQDATVVKLRDAVLDKNYEWSHRYRTVDQFNIYGGRSRIAYEGVTNAKILGQEMAQRDVKTANRDKRIWAVAKGGDLQVKDDNLPAVELTPSNVPQEDPYDDPEEAIKYLKLAEGCKVELVASEKQFPDLINPVQMNFDTKGRLWIAAWPNYPETTPTTKDFDKILIVDLDPKTGKATKVTTFMDGLNCPTGFQFYKDGILLMQSPDLLWARDTNGDDKADTVERVLSGMDAADSHHETNSMCYEPGGAVYLSDGVFLRSNVETTNGPVRNRDGGIYRYEPLTKKFMRHAPYNFANPHGRVFDYWGNDYITDATGNANYFGPAFSGHLDTGPHKQMKQFWDRPSRPCPGTAILTSRHFPDDWQGLFLNTNVISMQGIFRAKLSEDGSGMKGDTISNLIETDIAKNPNFRPSGITVAPDGSLYFMDWSQMLIGHLQHHLRDPNRDHQHGRLYRITYPSRPLMEPVKIDGQPVAALLQLLKEPENDIRLRAKIELGKHDAKEVTDGVMDWVKTLDSEDSKYEHNLLEALWVHQWHDVVNLPLLKRVMKSTDPRARTQAVRVLGYWRDRVPGAIAMVKAAAGDDAPRVRLEAVRVASFFRETAAADAALEVLKKPMDYYLTYCFGETMRQLEPWWKDAVAESKPIARDNPAGIDFLLASVATADLPKLPKSATTLTAQLTRPDAKPDQRAKALAELSEMNHAKPCAMLLEILKESAAKDNSGTRELSRILLGQPAADLAANRAALESLAATHGPAARAAAAALMVAEGSAGPAMAAAVKSPVALLEYLKSLAMVPDESIRAAAFEPVSKLLVKLPGQMGDAANSQMATSARFVRIELPRKGTLSLAEVQVMSGDKNVAPDGKATQINVAAAGGPQRAIDGNTGGVYEKKSVTHTEENIDRPWWELDLGAEMPVDSIAIWNRTDGKLGERLEGYDLIVYDGLRREIYRKAGNPEPKESATFEMHRDMAVLIRKAAISTLATMKSRAPDVFKSLAALIAKDLEVPAAAAAISKLPESARTGPETDAAAQGIVRWASKMPAADRTSPQYAATVGVARKLIPQLPAERAAAAEKALASLQVESFIVKTVREQLRYDTKRLVVEAGKPVEIVLENADLMPHNLVVVMPGTMQAVATDVQTMPPTQLDSKGRAYVREDDKRVIDATKLIEAGQTGILDFTAPKEEGEYEFVCTFPGHWTLMNGKMIVTKDVKAYLAAHPE